MTVRDLDLAIQQALSEGQAPHEDNRFRVMDLRNSVNEFFESLEERARRNPSERARTHATLLVMDVEPEQPASFVAVAVSPESIELLVGHGDAEVLHGTSLPASAPGPEGVLDPLHAASAGPCSAVRAPRQTLVAWSGYDPE